MQAVRASRQDDWRSNPFKVKKVRNAIRAVLEGLEAQAGVVLEAPAAYDTKSSESPEERVDRILELVKNQDEY